MILGGGQGKSFVVDYDQGTFLKDGVPLNYVSGNFHWLQVAVNSINFGRMRVVNILPVPNVTLQDSVIGLFYPVLDFQTTKSC